MDNIVTVSEFAKRHSAFTEGSLRWMIFNAASNGLNESGAIIRLGRKVLIDEDKFRGYLVNNSSTVNKTATA